MMMKRFSISGLGLLLAGLACTAFNAQAAERSLRPQLSPAEAANYSYGNVMRLGGAAKPWDPRADALDAGTPEEADYTVDARASADAAARHLFRSLHAALNQAVIDNPAWLQKHKARVYIRVKAGDYHELVYVPAGLLPITIYGEDPDPRHTLIHADTDAALSGSEYEQRFGAQFEAAPPAVAAMFDAVRRRPMLGTFGTAVLWTRNDGFQLRQITVENDYHKHCADGRPDDARGWCPEQRALHDAPGVHHQAVALMVEDADRVQFEQVRLLGLQDTLYLQAKRDGAPSRSYFNASYIEGDVDFIFGDATAYFENTEVRSLGDRPGSYALAPSTKIGSPFGFVFDQSRFSNDGSSNALASRYYLARQWFHNQRCTPYAPVKNVADYRCEVGTVDAYTEPAGTVTPDTLESVGKAVILNSRIGAHIDKAQPWLDWNTKGSSAYRPAQLDTDDFWNNLSAVGIDPARQLGLAARPQPKGHFLAEFNNVDE